jgi:peptidoglycan/LPS O-acetylase OafA/YrhL
MARAQNSTARCHLPVLVAIYPPAGGALLRLFDVRSRGERWLSVPENIPLVPAAGLSYSIYLIGDLALFTHHP